MALEKKKKVEVPRNRFVEAVVKLFASAGYVGYLPVMPGTYGTIAGVLLYRYMFCNIAEHMGQRQLGFFFLYLGYFLLGVFIMSLAVDVFNTDEVNVMVFDKVLGGMISVSAFTVADFDIMPGRIFVCFYLFRIFEITKVFPLNQLEKLPRGWGKMADDVGAGLMVLVVTLFFPDWLWDFLQFKWPTNFD